MNTFALLTLLLAALVYNASALAEVTYLSTQYHNADCTVPSAISLYDYKTGCNPLSPAFGQGFTCPTSGAVNLTTSSYGSKDCSTAAYPGATMAPGDGSCVVSASYLAPYYNSSAITCGGTIPAQYTSTSTSTYYSDNACTNVLYTLTSVVFPVSGPTSDCTNIPTLGQSVRSYCDSGATKADTYNALNCTGSLNKTVDYSKCNDLSGQGVSWTKFPACTPAPPPPPPPAPPLPASASICDRYSQALMVSNQELLTILVNQTINAVVAPTAPTKKYFDGTVKGTTNFLAPANSAQLTTLFGKLVAFFGLPSILNCSDPTFPAPYAKYNFVPATFMGVHQNLMISNSDFDYFNNALVGICTNAGVTQTDAASILTLLQSTRSLVVYQAAPSGATTAAPTSGNPTTAAPTSGTPSSGTPSSGTPVTPATTGSTPVTPPPAPSSASAVVASLVVLIAAVLLF